MREIFFTIGQFVFGPIFLGALTYIVYFFINRFNKYKDQYSTKKLVANCDKHQKIQDVLTEIRTKYDAERTYMSLFHNGDKYLEGSLILKKTRICESLANGISSQIAKDRDIHVFPLSHEMKLIAGDKPEIVKTRELVDSNFKRTLSLEGIDQTIRCGIKKNGDIIGFLGMDYVNREIENPNMEELLNYSGMIEQILSVK